MEQAERDVEYSKVIEIDGDKYLVNHPQVEEAWEIGVDLLKLVGGSAAAMAGGAKDEASAGAALSVAVNGLLKNIDGKSSMVMMKRLFRHVEVQPGGRHQKKMLLDDAGIKTHFHGRPGQMLRLAGEVIGFTHKDFFSAIGEGVAELMTIVAEKMKE